MNDDSNSLDLICAVCGQPATQVRCSSTGPVSFAYCSECGTAEREPYGALIASLVDIKDWSDVAEWYKPIITSNLEYYHKSQEELWEDVENARGDRAYFLTVDWCGKGNRGIFTDDQGQCFRKNAGPHTSLEIQTILGPFWIILAPGSLLITRDEMEEFAWFCPLSEYSGKFGVVLKESDLPNTGDDQYSTQNHL